MSIAERPRTIYAAERTEAGGWRITLPGAPPSQNTLDREHWRDRKRRVDGLAGDLLWLRMYRRQPEPTFERAALQASVWYATRRRHDMPNVWGGLKQHIDGLVRAGWLADDDSEHLRLVGEPVLDVDRDNPRVEVLLEPWDGVRP